MRMAGKHPWDHVCGMCNGKAAKRYWRVWVKRQKRREERDWRREL